MNKIIARGLGRRHKIITIGYGGSCFSGGEKITLKTQFQKVIRLKTRLWK